MITTALIIAAGAGSRLADDTHIPKPLRPVLGMPLLQRTILSLARAGLKKIFVVVGFEKDKIISFVNSQKWPVEIVTIVNPDWQKSNGISVLVAQNDIHENFILTMADHVFSLSLAKKICAESLEDVAAKLAVDYHVDTVFDIDDATKVQVVNERIVAIAKNLTSYNAIDTGLFLLSPEIFSILADEKKVKGDCSLSDGIRVLAESGRMGVCDIGKDFWQDVDTKGSLAHAEEMLLTGCRKESDGVVSRHFNRHISLFISKRLVKTKLTANQVTFFTTLVGLCSGYFAAQGSYFTYLLGAFLFKWASILDGVDGEMSKLRLTDSKLGQWLDTLSDNLTYVVFIVATFVGVMRRTDVSVPWFVGGAALFGLAGLILTMFGVLLASTNSGTLIAIQQDFLSGEKDSFLRWLWSKIYFVIKRDFFAAFFLVLAFFNKPHWILALIAVATNVAWIVVLQNHCAKVRQRHHAKT